MTTITMTNKELEKLVVIEQLAKGEINGSEAASRMHLRLRQVKRLKARYLREGAAGIVHRSRGKVSHNRYAHTETVIRLAKTVYAGFGPTFMKEKLWEHDQISISKETLRKLLIKEGLWEPR